MDAPSVSADRVTPLDTGAALPIVLAAMVLVVLSAGTVNVALPVLATALHTSAASAVRVVSAYQLGLVLALLPCAALGERLGLRAVWAWGLALFTLANGACALAPTVEWLVAARFVQGVGGAAVMALGVAIVRFSVPPSKLAPAIGWNAVAVALSSAAAPSVGALVLAHGRWPWIFAVHLPLAALVLAATPTLPRIAPAPRSKRSALVPVDLFRERSFVRAVLSSIACFSGQSAALIALPFYLREAFGCDTARAAWAMTPWPLAVALAAPIVGRAANRFAASALCAAGAALLSLSLAMLSVVRSSFSLAAALVALCGVGFAFFQVPNNRTMLLSAPKERSAAAGAMQATARLTGQSLGALAMTTLFTSLAVERAARWGLALGALFALFSATVSVTVRDRDL